MAACSPNAEDQEAARKQDVAMVEAGNELPVKPLSPDPIRYREIEQHDLFGAGCSFLPDGAGLSAVAIAQAEEGYLIRDGELLRLAADVGSRELPYMARERYVGREFAFTLELDEASGVPGDIETSRYRGKLTVTDAQERQVYGATGFAQCGA